MCQLAVYVGDKPMAPLLLRVIEHQEAYIGVYATGLGVIDDGILRVEKEVGHVRRVISSTNIAELKGTTGMCHSRYTAKYGGMAIGPDIIDDRVEENMREALKTVQDGRFAKGWIDEFEAGSKEF